MTKQEMIHELAATAQRKAHLEAIRHIQKAFEKELQSAGVKGVEEALAQINIAIGASEDAICDQVANLLFELT